jgi:hypothetical protein
MKEVVVQDTIYSEETVQKIVDLRHERWAILAVMSTHKARQAGTIFGAKEMSRMEQRLEMVKKELFELTQNPIYND